MKTRTKNGTNRAASPNGLVNLQGRETGPFKNKPSTQGTKKNNLYVYIFYEMGFLRFGVKFVHNRLRQVEIRGVCQGSLRGFLQGF